MRQPLRPVLCLIVVLGLVMSSALSALALPAPVRVADGPSAITADTYKPDDQECAFLGIINEYRVANQLPPLTISRTLGAAAEYHSLDMAANNYFSHTLSDGTTWDQNIANFGYPSNTARAENLAAGYGDAKITFQQWRNSAGHNANMLNGKFRAIGIGRAYNANSKHGWYWTNTFGSTVDQPYYCDGGTPAIALSRTKGKFNGVVDVTATGFTPGSQLTLKWDGVDLVTGVAGADGSAVIRFRVPLAVYGYHDVSLHDTQGRFASATFKVIPRILLNETSGPIDTKLRVYFYGFASGEQVEVRWYQTSTSYVVLTRITIASNGRGSSLIQIPAKTSLGPHKVVGKVIGVSRSASTTFTVTGVTAAEADASEATPSPTTTLEPTVEATPSVTETPVATETMVATETPAATEEPTLTPEPTEEIPVEPSATATATPAVADEEETATTG